MKVGHNEKSIWHADHIWERTLDKLTDNEPVVKFSSMESMNDEVKHNIYVSRNIAPFRTPNNGNNTIDNNNETLPDANDTPCNANTNSTNVNETSGLRIQQEGGTLLLNWTMCNSKLGWRDVLM